MKELMSLISAGVADLPLRPLLYTAGAAATAAGIYCFIKRGDGEKTPDPEDTTPSEDPVCDQATEPALVQPVEVPQDQVTDAVTEAEEKIQKLVVSNTQLEDRVRELEELLCEARRDCDMKNKAFEREQWAHGILQLKHDDMKEFMKVSLTKAEEKHQKALETIAQVEAEKSDLTDQVETLQGTVQYMWKLLCKTQRKADDLTKEREQEREAHSILQAENDVLKKTLIQKEELLKVQVETLQGTVQYMWKLLCKTQRKADDLTKEREQEREAHSILQAENDELKKTLIQKEELLKVSLAEAEEKHQKAVETNAQLEAEKSDLMYQVETLQGTVQDMGNLLCETHRECDQLTNERDREREAHSILQTENDELKKTLMHKDEFLKVSLTEAEEKHQKAVETIAQLEAEKSDLTYQVETLQGTVQDMGNLLSETHRQCDELTNERERELVAHSILQSEHKETKEKLKHCEELLMEHEREAYGILQAENNEMKKILMHNEELLKECERQREAHSILQAENDQMKETLLHNEEFLKVFLAEAEEKHQKAVETIAQLEAEKSDMTYQVETLRGRVQDMGNLLCESHSQCDKLMNEREREREAHSILQVENDEMKKTLIQKEELLKEREREQEAHSILQAENDELMKTMIQKEELLKVSLAEAEEKHQKAVETNAQLEAKISDLMYQVETLQGTMQDMGNLLYETNRECDQLTNEREREREVHSILQAENDEMKKTLIQKEEFLKASFAEAEEKHQKAVETNAQLEVEKSNLTYQVETLRGTVQESGNLLSETHRQCDELTNECEREREAHSILQSEHNEMKEKLKHCEELLMEREREQEVHSILQAENDEMKKTLIEKEELLKVSLAEAEEKHQKAVETNAQLEAKISDLMYQVETLQGTMQDMGNLLYETNRECDQLTNEREREREAHSILQAENDEMKKTLIQKEELLKASLAEAEEKHQKAVETIAQLEVEKSNLTYQVETLRGTVQESGNLLSETHRQCDELTNECEREREAHSILQSEHNEMKEKLKHCEELLMEREREREVHSILQAENDEMKNTLTDIEELLKVSLAEAEEKHQKAVETNAQLEAKISDLMYQVETLQGTMQDMGNLLYETNRECDQLTNEREREREAHSILQAENDEMKKTLIQKEELLKASLAEAEEKHQKAVETIAQLEAEKSNLTYQVETLRGTVQESGNLLSETHRQCDELTNECEREREAHSILQSEHNEMKEKLKHCEELLMEREREQEVHSILQAENDEMKNTLMDIEELLKVSLAEAEEKHQKAVETNAQLEAKISDLMYQVETLQGTMQDMGNLLYETNRECDQLTNEHEQELEAHSILQAENDELKKTLIQKEELLKASLAEAEEKHQKAVETIAQLEVEKSNLTYQVETLRGTVQESGNLLSETHRQCDELMNECEREREAHSILQSEHNETKEKLKHCEELLMEREREREVHSILQAENDEMKNTLTDIEELLKVSLAEAEEKHQKAVETNAQLEAKISDLMYQVETLQGTMQDMGNLLYETNRECDQLTNEHEQELEAHSILQAENDELKKTLIQKEELLKASLAEAEEKHQKAVETIAQLEVEKSNLTYQVETLRGTVQESGNLLSETHRQCDELTNECEREREAHSILQSEHNEMKEKLKHCEELLMEREREQEVHSILQAENDEMKNTLMDIEELLKVSLAEAEEKHQKAVETNAQLEAKISDLMYQVETLQGTMQDMGNLLSETNRECDQLTNEHEQELEAHSILQAENDELKKTLIQKEELLKASLAEAEEKHQKAVETIAQLEAEKSNLTYQVETLQGTVQESGNLLSETHRQCDELTNECEREREAHSILQSEHNEMKEKLKHCEELLMEREREQEVHSILQAENDEMKNTLTDIEELLKVSLAEAEEKHQKAVETNAQLEAKISDLMYQVETLQGTVQDMGNLLYETNRECDQLTNECEREREGHSILQSEHNETKEKLKHCEELLMECERQREAHSVLNFGFDEMKETLMHNEKLLKECEREREAHHKLKLEYDEMKKTLTHSEELLKVSLAEVEEKYNKAVESIAKLEAEKSNLKYHMETVRDTMQDIRNVLSETDTPCDELTNKHGVPLGSKETTSIERGSSVRRIGSTSKSL